jgi:hypothetical protein
MIGLSVECMRCIYVNSIMKYMVNRNEVSKAIGLKKGISFMGSSTKNIIDIIQAKKVEMRRGGVWKIKFSTTKTI